MKITKKAQQYMQEQAKQYENPALVVFERVYRGWCGTEVINTVVLAEKKQIGDVNAFEEKKMENLEFPLYLDKKLISMWDTTKVDLVGWSSFKRLALV